MKRIMKKLRIMVPVIALIMIFAGLNAYAAEVKAASETVSYIDENGNEKTAEAKIYSDAYVAENISGWYAVKDTARFVTRASVKEGETLNLILTDNSVLTAERGITVPKNSTINIYCASTGSGMGKLVVPYAETYNAGIGAYAVKSYGGASLYSGGNIHIYGGDIDVKGGNYSAGIGGEYTCGFQSIVIKGGARVKAEGGTRASGIGVGLGGYGGSVMITGDAEVTVQGKGGAKDINGGDRGSMEVTSCKVNGIRYSSRGFNVNKPWFGVVFMSNGGSEVPDQYFGEKYGETAPEYYMVTRPADPVKELYRFKGWYVYDRSTDNKGELYDFEGRITNRTGNLYLIADWELKEYKISYVGVDLKDNIYNPNPLSYSEADVKDGPIMLKDPEKKGLRFVGFYDNKDHTGGKITEIPKGSDKDVVLYAWWQEIVDAPKITFTGGDTYTGSEIKPSFTVKSSGGIDIDSSEYTVTWANNKNAGTATLILSPKEDAKQFYVRGSKNFTINPKTISISSVSAENRSYEQGNKTVKVTGVTFNGVVDGDTVDYSAAGEMENDSAGNSKDFTATVTINSRNYVLGSNTGSGTVNIEKAEYPYGVQGATVAVATSAGQADGVAMLEAILDVIVSAGGTNTIIGDPVLIGDNAAGVSNVVVPDDRGTRINFRYAQSEPDKESNIKVLIESDNYEPIEIRIFVITYTNVTGVSFNGYSGKSEGKWVLSYGGNPELNKITAEAVNEGGSFTWSCNNTEVAEIEGTGEGKTVSLRVKKPGTALITARYKKDGWTGLSSIPLLVKKGDPNPAYKETSYSYVYGDTPLELKKEDISSNPGNGDVTFSYKPKDAEDSRYVSVPPTEAGSYTARAVIAETEYYGSAECTVDYIVEKRPVDLKSAVPERRSYEPGNKGVVVYEGEFTDKDGREVQNFYPGIDYTISGNMIDDKAGKDKAVTVKAVCLNPNYVFNTDTVTCTTDIYKAMGEAHGQQEVVTFKFLKNRARKNMRLDLSGAAERESGARLTSAHLRMDRHGVIENVGVGADYEFTVSGNCILFDMAASDPYSDPNEMADIGAVFETDNYIDYEETVLIEIVDSKDETEVKIGDGERERTLSYGDEGFTLKASAPATKEAGHYTWYSSNSYVAAVDINTGEVTVKNAGTAVITAFFESDSKMGSAQLKLTVEAVDAEITPPEAVKGLVYNGSMQELIKPGTVVGGKMYYALSTAAGTVPDIESFSEDVPSAKDPGTYYVYYLVNADNNHKDVVDIPEPISVTVIDRLRVPVSNPEDVFASSDDNIAAVCTSGKIKKLGLDFSKVKGSGVDPMGLKMTVIAGSKLTTTGTLSDKSKVTVTDGIKVKYKKSSKTATVICKANGTATFNMEDGNVYKVEFTVEKPKAVKSEKKMEVGGAKVTKTALDLFKTTVDGGVMTVLKEKKAGQAEASGSSVTINPAEKDSIKLQYKFLNKKYKTAIKIK